MRLSRRRDPQQNQGDGRRSAQQRVPCDARDGDRPIFVDGDVRAPKRRHKKTRCLRVVVSSTTQASRLHQCGELRRDGRTCESHTHRRDRNSVPCDSAMADTNAAWWLDRRTRVPAQGAHRMHSRAHVNASLNTTDQRRCVNDRRRDECGFSPRTIAGCRAAADRALRFRGTPSIESSPMPRVPRATSLRRANRDRLMGRTGRPRFIRTAP